MSQLLAAWTGGSLGQRTWTPGTRQPSTSSSPSSSSRTSPSLFCRYGFSFCIYSLISISTSRKALLPSWLCSYFEIFKSIIEQQNISESILLVSQNISESILQVFQNISESILQVFLLISYCQVGCASILKYSNPSSSCRA